MSVIKKYAPVAAGGLAALAGIRYLDNQILLANDVNFARKGISLLRMSRAAKNVADVWYLTLAKAGIASKACLRSVEYRDTIYTYAEVEALSNQVAHWALSKGFKPRDVVALFMENRPAYVITWLGLAKVGVTVAWINSNNKMKPLIHSIEISKAKALLFGSELASQVQGVLSHLKRTGIDLVECGGPGGAPAATSFASSLPDECGNLPRSAPSQFRAARSGLHEKDTFAYIYTSGTTGLPKACVITHQKYLGAGSMLCAIYGVQESDTLFHSGMPLYHSAAGMLGVGCVMTTGVTMVLSRKFSASTYFKTCTELGVTAIQYIGELARYLLNSPPSKWDRRHRVRVAIGNGMRREVWLDFVNRFNIPQIGEFYGATEGNVGFANHWIRDEHEGTNGVGSVGRVGWVQKKIVGWKLLKHDVETEMPVRNSKTGFCEEVATGQPGELVGLISESNPASDFRGYSDPKATAKKILTDVLAKGDKYFRTGDLLRQDPDGWVYFVDRIGDTFRWKGENVSTNEVSEVVSVFPGVTEANVYGVKVPGSADGRACMVALTTSDGAPPDLQKLHEHCKTALASYAMPVFVRLLPAMESTGTFKQRKVTFVKEGVDIAVVKDKIWFLKKGRYYLLTPSAYGEICAGRARL